MDEKSDDPAADRSKFVLHDERKILESAAFSQRNVNISPSSVGGADMVMTLDATDETSHGVQAQCCPSAGQSWESHVVDLSTGDAGAKAFLHYRTGSPRHQHLPPQRAKSVTPCVRYEVSLRVSGRALCPIRKHADHPIGRRLNPIPVVPCVTRKPHIPRNVSGHRNC